MKRIGIFGGTFDPVHIEHIKIAQNAITELGLDKLIIMPDYLPPHKNVIPTPHKNRLDMLKLVFSGEKTEVSDYEINQKGKSYTYSTVLEYKKRYPNAELFFIVGADMLVDFKTWKNPQTILDNCTLAVFGRENVFIDYAFEQDYFVKTFNKKFVKLKFTGKDCSATKIRVYSALNLPIDGLVDSKVEQYIKENNLFSSGKLERYIIKNLKPSRIVHTANVIITALKKAKELNIAEEKVYVSALLHDCAKYKSVNDYPNFSLEKSVPPPVVHAFLGEYIARTELNILDEDILDAIKYHTSGKAEMTDLAKLIFLADMIEPLRDYKEVEELRRLYDVDFNACFIKAVKYTMDFLIEKGQPIFYETINAYDYYVKGERK